MLNAFREKWVRHVQSAVYSFQVLCQKPLSTFITVVAIAVALTLPALFWVLSDNFRKITNEWQHRAHISIYLALHQDLASQKQVLTAVQAVEGVERATLKTPDEGLRDLEKQEGMQDLMHYLPDNPLPAAIDVVPFSTFDTPLKLEQLCNQLQHVPGVAQVKLDLEWVKRLQLILSIVRIFASLLMGLLAAAVVLIIGNTLRLAMHHRQEEILVLKLIGATDAYILRPFIYSGIWYGLFGAIMAIFLVNAFLFSLSFAAERLATIYEIHYAFIGLTLKQAYLMVIFSSFLGIISSQCFVRSRIASIEVG